MSDVLAVVLCLLAWLVMMPAVFWVIRTAYTFDKAPSVATPTDPDHTDCEAEAASLRARLKRAVTMRRKAFRQRKRRQ